MGEGPICLYEWVEEDEYIQFVKEKKEIYEFFLDNMLNRNESSFYW